MLGGLQCLFMSIFVRIVEFVLSDWYFLLTKNNPAVHVVERVRA